MNALDRQLLPIPPLKLVYVRRRANRMVRFMLRKYTSAPISTPDGLHARHIEGVNGRDLGYRHSTITMREMSFSLALGNAYIEYYKWRISNRADLLAAGAPQMLAMTPERRKERNIALIGIRIHVLQEFADRDAVQAAERTAAERAAGSKLSAERRAVKWRDRDRRIHDGHAVGKKPKVIAGEEGLSPDRVRAILRKPRP